MPRLKAIEWLKARAFYESGASQSAVAEKFGVSRKAVQLKIEGEGWIQDIEGQIKARVAEKLAGKLAGGDLKETRAAVEVEADRRVKISERHVKLAEQATALQQQAVGRVGVDEKGNPKFAPDFDLQKSAKINSETVAILIGLERKIHKLEDAPPAGEPTKIVFARYEDE